MATCSNILGTRLTAYHLFIALHGQSSFFRRAVENSKHSIAIILARYDVDAIVRNKVFHAALRNDVVALTPVEQLAKPTEHAVLGA